MYFVCECGAEFDEDKTGAAEHMLEQHLDLVESYFEDLIVSDEDGDVFTEFTEEEIYDEALDEVIDDMLDQFMDRD